MGIRKNPRHEARVFNWNIILYSPRKQKQKTNKRPRFLTVRMLAWAFTLNDYSASRKLHFHHHLFILCAHEQRDWLDYERTCTRRPYHRGRRQAHAKDRYLKETQCHAHPVSEYKTDPHTKKKQTDLIMRRNNLGCLLYKAILCALFPFTDLR